MSVHQLFPATRPAAGLPPILFPIESMGRMEWERVTATALHDNLADDERVDLTTRQLSWCFRLDRWIARFAQVWA